MYYRFISLFPPLDPTRDNLIRKLRRLVHQRNYWRNRTRDLRGRRKR